MTVAPHETACMDITCDAHPISDHPFHSWVPVNPIPECLSHFLVPIPLLSTHPISDCMSCFCVPIPWNWHTATYLAQNGQDDGILYNFHSNLVNVHLFYRRVESNVPTTEENPMVSTWFQPITKLVTKCQSNGEFSRSLHTIHKSQQNILRSLQHSNSFFQ